MRVSLITFATNAFLSGNAVIQVDTLNFKPLTRPLLRLEAGRPPSPDHNKQQIKVQAMAQPAPDLPTRFPCWCKAVYSWGGESDRDLGFVEGDLIECLNAGDGSWWMGRLRRDKRMMGLFPSNFVQVLDDSFRPASRATSPMPGLQQNGGGSISRANSPSPEKKKPNRKPFSGYKTPTPMSTPPSTSRPTSRDTPKPFDPANPPSTVLWAQAAQNRSNSRSASPMPGDIGSSPPPPAPPPHRVAIAPRATSPAPHSMNDRYQIFSRTPSPGPASMHGHTPPMLRDAMDEVMSSLEGMSMQQENGTGSGFNPWSPEAFDSIHNPNSARPPARPLTSLGLGAGGSNYDAQPGYSSNHNSPDRYMDGPPQLSNYVQRMESRLKQMHEQNGSVVEDPVDEPPQPPPKNSPYAPRPPSSTGIGRERPSLKARKSAYELGRNVLNRTFTIKSNTTNSSSGVQSNATTSSSKTNRSIMSGHSAGAFSATSAGSLARRNQYRVVDDGRPMTSMVDLRTNGFLDATRGGDLRPQTPLTGISYHSSHDSRQGAQSAVPWLNGPASESAGMLGGFAIPKAKKQGFFKKLMDGAKTGAASARSSIAASQTGSLPPSPIKSRMTGIAGGIAGGNSGGRDAAREMGLGGGNIDWVQVRRDVNRSTSISAMERKDRAARCQMLDHPVIYPLDELYEAAEGDESADGLPVAEPIDFNAGPLNLHLVDKAARFVSSLPPMTTPTSLAQGYVCRPHRSDVQRLRAIFTWVSEKIAWDEDFEGEIDTRRVIQTKRGCSHEVAALVADICAAIGVHAEVVRGYLKTPGESLDLDANVSHPNHYWNSVLVDGEWRIMDCSLASPTNPRRGLYSSSNTQAAEPWYFLARPTQVCFTHIPVSPEHQHICPPIAPEVLLALPAACPSYFKNNVHLHDYDTSLIRLEGLEIATIHVAVPLDIEVIAELEVKAFMRDQDGDYYENGDVVKKRALSQPSWHGHPSNPTAPPQKRYTVKALLPADEGTGVLKVYAGKRGLMHSSKDIPHPLAFALPIHHEGENPPYDFLIRHPTPHATRHDLYVIQPQCHKLGWNNTFVFAVRQHPSSLDGKSPDPNSGAFDSAVSRPVSPAPFTRPSSAMSMTSSSANGSSYDTPATSLSGGRPPRDVKPAKLAIQAPSGKILRLTRKAEAAMTPVASVDGSNVEGSVWETVVKVGERGTWRGLVLADRSARWCVWGEWECV